MKYIAVTLAGLLVGTTLGFVMKFLFEYTFCK